MQLKKLGPSMTELELADGRRVLFSYETPVAAFLPSEISGQMCGLDHEGDGHECGEYVKSDKFFSRTTTSHVSKWLGENKETARTIKHDTLLLIVKGAH